MPDGFNTPDWVHHAVFYQIFPDRFACSREVEKPSNLEPWFAPPTPAGFKGGDLLGVTEKLDYLQDLGVNAIYFTPVFQSAANHRYHTHDYFKIDPILGGNPAFFRLRDEAHRRGMRIVLDGVFNHASRGFFQFNHILENGPASPYLDWFDIRSYPLNAYYGQPNYRCWVGLAELPEFNFKNPQVRQYIYSIAHYWIDQGIDGWRLDVPFCVDDDDFWQGFRAVVKSANPNAYITGEIPNDARRWLQGDQFDGVMNYLFTYGCWSFFGGPGFNDAGVIGHWIQHAEPYLKYDAGEFLQQQTELLKLYPRPAAQAQLNLLDSHDTTRVLTIFNQNKALLRLATLFQMVYPGAPCVYYGNEIGMEGGPDPDNRRAFPWNSQRWDSDLRAYFKRIIALRHAHPALRTGEFIPLYGQGQVLACLSRLGTDRVVTVINRSIETLHLDISLSAGLLEEGTVLHNKLGEGQAVVQNGHLQGLNLAPLSGAVLI